MASQKSKKKPAANHPWKNTPLEPPKPKYPWNVPVESHVKFIK